MENTDFITKEFLERSLSRSLKDFRVGLGSKPGDNFMSTLFSISVNYNEVDQLEKKTCHHFLLKCFPSHLSRQTFLIKGNLFYNELCFYLQLSKELSQFQTELIGLPPESSIPLPIPPFIGGKAIDYFSQEFSPEMVYNPLDNYLLMVDMRKEFAFKMADSKIGLDEEHMTLAFTQLATLHALSWAYKVKGRVNLEEKFAFLKKSSSSAVEEQKKKLWAGILAENAEKAVQAIDSALGTGNKFSKAVEAFTEDAGVISQYFRNPEEKLEACLKDMLKVKIEEGLPIWRVASHGDCWTNNLLFRYDEQKKPVEVTFIDFPLAKLACPMMDLACLVYTSTRKEFRQKYLPKCLKIYFTRFQQVCKEMELKPEELPEQFCLEIMDKKFQVCKLVGFFIALISLPLNLIENDDNPGNDNSFEAVLRDASDSGSKTLLYKEWILELVQDLYEEGVI